MNTRWQCCTYEQAIRLKELGLYQNAGTYSFVPTGTHHAEQLMYGIFEKKEAVAYTFAEIYMLLDYLSYNGHNKFRMHDVQAPAAHIAADILIQLIEHGAPVDELNELLRDAHKYKLPD